MGIEGMRFRHDAFPDGIAVIDTMMGTTAGTTGKDRYKFLDRALKDAESANMNFPAQYMFKDVAFSDQARNADGERLAADRHGFTHADEGSPAFDNLNCLQRTAGIVRLR